MGAASDVGEIVLGVMGLADGVAPATLNFESPDEACRGLQISSRPQSLQKPGFLALSYGMGGQSTAMVVTLPR
jgi:3-oxoacyl-(acyl-carrier-protein) synthase